MKLKHTTLASETHGKNFVARAAKAAASAVVAAYMLFSPLNENVAQAQERPETAEHGPRTRSFSGEVRQGTQVLSLLSSERIMGEQVFPATIADVNVSAVDATGVEFSVTLVPGHGRQENATFRVNYDGTRSGAVGVIGALGFRNFTVQQGGEGSARLSFDYSERPARRAPEGASGDEVRPFRRRHALREYEDPALSHFGGTVDMAGRRRDFTLDNPFDVGGNVYANEAGSSVWATARYALRNQGALNLLDLRLSAGNMWFGEQAAPFAALYLRPGLDIWRFRLNYYGTVATVGNMPSWMYTAHSLGLGYSQPLGEHTRLRLGAVGGGALSYPAWDDIYFNMVFGASFEHRGFLAYAMPGFYFAANDPIRVAYVGYYRPQFQNVEFGIQMRFYEDQYTARLWGDVSTLYQRFGGRLTRSWNMSDDVALDVWGAVGATHWINELGGRWDPVAMAGLRVVLGGRSINSTNTFRYEHLQSGGVRFARTEFPSQEAPGPYGFGRSGNPDVDAQVNDAKNRMLSSPSLQSFSTGYGGSSYSDIIMTARFMGAFAQQVAYAHNAWDRLNNTSFFDPEVVRIASQSPDTIYQFLRRAVEFYNTHPPNTPLPPDMVAGIAMCGGVGYVQSMFLNANGIPTIVASVNTPRGPHMVPIAMPPDGTVLLDYGNTYETPPGTFDQAMRFYGQNRRAPTFQSQLFGRDGQYMGTYITSEGRLLHQSIGIVNSEILGTDFLGVR